MTLEEDDEDIGRGRSGFCQGLGKADVRLPEKGNPTSHGARPVHLIITPISGFGIVGIRLGVDRKGDAEEVEVEVAHWACTPYHPNPGPLIPNP